MKFFEKTADKKRSIYGHWDSKEKENTAGINVRKLLRAIKKGFIDKESEERTSYSAGNF